jgi:hypothetical protein
LKSVNFKPKSTSFRVLNEEVKEKKRRRINWDRLFYFIFFGAFILGIGYYLSRRYLYVRANGLVLFQNVSVRIAQDSRMDSLLRIEGDSVHIGDTLFIYTKLHEKTNTGIIKQQLKPTSNGSQDWRTKEKFNVEMEISENNVQIKTDENMLKEYKAELKGLENQVALGLLPLSRLESVKTEIMKLQGNIQKLKSANAQLRSFMGKLNTPGNDSLEMANATILSNLSDSATANIPFISPIDGVLSRSYFYQFEVAPKNEVIMTLQKDSGSFVRAYFRQEDWSSVKVGDVVDLFFPDGNTCQGEIKKIYNTTFALPPELQLQYEPIQRMVVGDIYPLKDKESCDWNTFSRSGVKVSKTKYW